MSLATHMRMMARNNLWSNLRLLGACAKLSNEEFRATRTSFFPSLHETLNHILAVDRYYIDALDNGGLGPRAFTEFKPYDDAASLAEAQEVSDRKLLAICDAETEDSLKRMVATDRGEKGRVDEVRGDLIAHLFLHQIHHRGQAHAMLAGTSVKPPQLDEYFLNYDRLSSGPELRSLGIATPEAFRQEPIP
ncbi:DinB family protein [Terrarubrum flagellatum]|uniref:DinB family protein n=1 Tax=Terrirubrum flagellatum TaxID=2895980 RepID=UPI0031452B0B